MGIGILVLQNITQAQTTVP